MVGIVIVSHSHELAVGVCELARQMTGGQPVPIVPAGGTDDGRIGTSLEKVSQALKTVFAQAEDVLVLADLGSAVMITQMACESLPPEQRAHVSLSDAPFVEGAIAAAVAAAGGGDIMTVKQAAEGAQGISKIPSEGPTAEPTAETEEPASVLTGEPLPTASVDVQVINPTGLHARPAALFVRTAMRFHSHITVQNITHNRPPANAKSMMDVASRGTAMEGETIRIVAQGEDADEAIAALRQLVAEGFGEISVPVPSPPLEPKVKAGIDASPTPSSESEQELPSQLQGIPASEGIAIAPAFPYRPFQPTVEQRTVADVEAEIARLHTALQQAQQELSNIQGKIATQDENVARIFEFQRMLLEDPAVVSTIEEEIRSSAINAEAAVERAIDAWTSRFTELDETMQLRAADVQDVGRRLIRVLMGHEEQVPLSDVSEPVIVVAQDLTPSDTAHLERAKVAGLCTAMGGATSHVAILARMWGLPAVVGAGDAVLRIPAGTPLVIDGQAGRIEVAPPPHIIRAYQQQARQQARRHVEALSHAAEPAITLDGCSVEIVANVGDVASAQEALRQGAEGIGLLRTEFLYLDRPALPTEEEQIAVYRAIAQVMGERPVIIRTLDVGGDKPLPSIPRPAEANPALGMRAIRLSRHHPDLLRIQLRAILQAGVGHNLKVMFPLVATMEELKWAFSILREAEAELDAADVAHVKRETIEVGIMIETPAAAMMADLLAPAVDFFSIGSNDLTQYTLACDRGNERLGALFNPLDPAVLRLIARTIQAAHKADIWVGVCGEMAGQRLAIPILLGMGLDEFSMTPAVIPVAKALIRALDTAQARRIADHVLTLPTATEVQQYVAAELDELAA